VRDEHAVQVVDAPQEVAELSLPDLYDQGSRIGVRVAVGQECARAGRSGQFPGVVGRAGAVDVVK
jgi:hypothetical protein